MTAEGAIEIWSVGCVLKEKKTTTNQPKRDVKLQSTFPLHI